MPDIIVTCACGHELNEAEIKNMAMKMAAMGVSVTQVEQAGQVKSVDATTRPITVA
ncbi:MAG TPA: hypothetical protein VIG74_00740 [Alphaproteobacteria bacterium]|jgi:hypothetical protein